MRSIFKILFFYSIIVLIVLNCEKEDINKKDSKPDDEIIVDSENPILGKWELEQKGGWPNNMEYVNNPDRYKEFQEDSICKVFFYDDSLTLDQKYWINDSLLFIDTYLTDTSTMLIIYEYEFLDDSLQLYLKYTNILAAFNHFIYKRIK